MASSKLIISVLFYCRIISCSEGTSGCGLCGSSWISGKQLLTAAHCVDANQSGNKPDHKVYVYQWLGNGGDFSQSTGPAYIVPTDNVVLHANWNLDLLTSGYDIAILNVPREDDSPNIIKLASQAETEQLTRCDFFTAYGTGTINTGQPSSDQLLKTGPLQNLNCHGNFEGDLGFYGYWKDNVLQGYYNLQPNTEAMVCVNTTVEYQELGYSTVCQGDSGGPLVRKDKLFGLTSYNMPPCDGGLPSMFTSVGHYSGKE